MMVQRAQEARWTISVPTVTGYARINRGHVKDNVRAFGLFIAACLLTSMAAAYGADDPTVASEKDGRYTDKQGFPTYKVQPDGKVDWATFSGFRRYHAECHVCHGPDGEGSTYAPALKNSLKTITYPEFLSIVAAGRQNVSSSQENVMPSFGDNKNVVCYLDDIYVYLRARSNDAIPRGRPGKHEEKPDASKKAETECMG
jgi:methanol metabolism-related c-type cytochrome